MGETKLTISSVMDCISETQEAETGDGITDYTYNQGYDAIKALLEQEQEKSKQEKEELLKTIKELGQQICDIALNQLKVDKNK